MENVVECGVLFILFCVLAVILFYSGVKMMKYAGSAMHASEGFLMCATGVLILIMDIICFIYAATVYYPL